MALVKVTPMEAQIRWDRAMDRPVEVNVGGRHVRIVHLDAVRDERAAFPADRGPRLTLVVRTGDGGRASLAFDGRRWMLEAVETAA